MNSHKTEVHLNCGDNNFIKIQNIQRNGLSDEMAIKQQGDISYELFFRIDTFSGHLQVSDLLSGIHYFLRRIIQIRDGVDTIQSEWFNSDLDHSKYKDRIEFIVKPMDKEQIKLELVLQSNKSEILYHNKVNKVILTSWVTELQKLFDPEGDYSKSSSLSHIE